MIILPKSLRLLVENYIRASNRKRELGGYFYGSSDKFTAFLPAINYSDTPHRSFRKGETGRIWSEEFGRMIGRDPVAEMHTHPNGSVASEGDRKYIQAHKLEYEVVIADQGERLRWFVIDRKMREVGIIETNEELDDLSRLFEIELGLLSLGRAFLDESNNTLVISSKIGRVLLSLDRDALQIYGLMKDADSYRRPSQARLRDITGLSAQRIKKALNKLIEGGLIEI